MILGISNQIYFMVSKKLTVMVLSMFYVRCFKVFSTSIHNSVLTLFGSVTCYMVMFWNLSVYCEEKNHLYICDLINYKIFFSSEQAIIKDD